MGLAELTQSHSWKNFMAKLYGIGASVVIVGALFKIMHWPGAGPMLIAGLGTEAIIFFFSAFEPLHEEVDWTLVYPELAGIGEHDEIDVKKTKKGKENAGDSLAKFDEMLEKAGGAGLFDKLGTGLNNLSEKVNNLNTISDSAVATNEFAKKVQNASASVDNLSEAYKKSSVEVTSASQKLTGSVTKAGETLQYSVESLADTYNKSNEKVKGSNEAFLKAYQTLTGSMTAFDFSALKEGNKEYSEKMGTLNKNLAALNAIFEMQLNEADLDKMMEDLHGSVAHSKKYSDQISKLGKRIEALNTVYGNMLAAMNIKVE